MKKLFFTLAAASFVLFAPMAARAAEADLLARLNHIEENQDRILAALDEIKAELQVIKVRASN